jgi:hypothetical protein
VVDPTLLLLFESLGTPLFGKDALRMRHAVDGWKGGHTSTVTRGASKQLGCGLRCSHAEVQVKKAGDHYVANEAGVHE